MEHPTQHSRCEHLHVQETGQQEHHQGQDEEGPEKPVDRGTSEARPRQGYGGGAVPPTSAQHHPCNSSY